MGAVPRLNANYRRVGARSAAIRAAMWVRIALMATAVLLSGCGTLLRNPVPPSLTSVAVIPNMPDVRFWAGRPSAAMERDLADSFRQESRDEFPPDSNGVVHYPQLALSGGGANGAFGAGFLNGWTTTGKRPVFKFVTGVSTGALMAPFAFLGHSYDDALREFYTTTASRDIFIVGSLFTLAARLLTGEALADTGPLVTLIEQHVDAELLQRVAAAHARGRRLYIGTVDLDAQRFVVWNMGVIASSGDPDALALFRKVMLASASIPIAFPPVYFDVEADGRSYDEMHVDGGVGARVFIAGGLFRHSIFQQRGGLGSFEATGGHLRHPQWSAPFAAATDAQDRAGHRDAGPGCVEPIRGARGPVAHLCRRAISACRLSLGDDSRRNRDRRRGNLRSGPDARAVRNWLPHRAGRAGLGNASTRLPGRSAALKRVTRRRHRSQTLRARRARVPLP